MKDGLVFKQKIIIGLFMFVFVLSVQAASDPTRPPGLNSAPARVTTVKKGPRWVLTSTLVSPVRRSAVINNRVVVLGDRVRGATVVEISPSRVRLRSGSSDVTLVMLKKNVKMLSRQKIR